MSTEEETANGIPNNTIQGAPSLVIDIGSHSTKVGYSTDPNPLVERSIVGSPRRRYVDQFSESIFVGDELRANQSYLSIFSPLNHGNIKDRDIYGQLFSYTAYKTRPYEEVGGRCIQSYPYQSTDNYLQLNGELAFEACGFDANLMVSSGTLSLFSNGVSSGLGIEMGHGVTVLTPIDGGYVDQQATVRFDVAGEDIHNHLQLLLAKGGYHMTKYSQIDLLEDITKNYCYVSLDSGEEDQQDISKTMTLPDGHIVSTQLGTDTMEFRNELFWAPEVLFAPYLTYQPETVGLLDQIWKSIKKSSMGSRRNMMSNVVLSGGVSQMTGLRERVEQDLTNTAPVAIQNEINVTVSKLAESSAWFGGKIMDGDQQREKLSSYWVTKEMYAEYGANVFLTRGI